MENDLVKGYKQFKLEYLTSIRVMYGCIKSRILSSKFVMYYIESAYRVGYMNGLHDTMLKYKYVKDQKEC